MAASNADIGYDSSIGIGDTSAGPFTDVVEVVNITPPGMQRDEIEVTHLKSDDQYKEFVAGIKEAGECSFGINFVPSATDAIAAHFEAKSRGFQITFPNNVTLTFAGFVKSYEFGELSNDKMSASVTIKVSGKAVLA